MNVYEGYVAPRMTKSDDTLAVGLCCGMERAPRGSDYFCWLMPSLRYAGCCRQKVACHGWGYELTMLKIGDSDAISSSRRHNRLPWKRRGNLTLEMSVGDTDPHAQDETSLVPTLSRTHPAPDAM